MADYKFQYEDFMPYGKVSKPQKEEAPKEIKLWGHDSEFHLTEETAWHSPEHPLEHPALPDIRVESGKYFMHDIEISTEQYEALLQNAGWVKKTRWVSEWDVAE